MPDAHCSFEDEIDALRSMSRNSRCFEVLQPDGKFQIVSHSVSELHGWLVELARSGLCSLIEREALVIVMVGKCRVGSTPLMNAFAQSGIQSLYQPLKTALRLHLVNDMRAGCISLDSSGPVALIKETIGPFTVAESILNPVECLLDAGFSADRIKLIALDREPSATAASWCRHFLPKTNLDRLCRNFVHSSLTCERIKQAARQYGVETISYVHEASKAPVYSTRCLFDRLGLSRYFSQSTYDWGDQNSLNSEHCRILWPLEEADTYSSSGHHDSAGRYNYIDSAGAEISPIGVDILSRYGIEGFYKRSLFEYQSYAGPSST